MRLLGLIPLWAKAAIAVAIFAALSGAFLAYRHSVYMSGWNDALASVAAQNAIARRAAEEVAADSDKCFDDGGTWNVVTGKCDPA